MNAYIVPDWPLPKGVRSLITTRHGGVSTGPYSSFNLAAHVDDRPHAVAENRRRLGKYVGAQLHWLTQTHSIVVAEITGDACLPAAADAAISRYPGSVCAVLTADCLPILLVDQRGEQVAAVHAGWRGLADGIISEALKRFDCPSGAVIAYLGPAISPRHFEVGGDVLQAFVSASQRRPYSEPVGSAFQRIEAVSSHEKTKYLCDLYRLAKSEMLASGVRRVYGGDYCTFDDDRFYSYRKEGTTGRMASLIWREG